MVSLLPKQINRLDNNNQNNNNNQIFKTYQEFHQDYHHHRVYEEVDISKRYQEQNNKNKNKNQCRNSIRFQDQTKPNETNKTINRKSILITSSPSSYRSHNIISSKQCRNSLDCFQRCRLGGVRRMRLWEERKSSWL
jgi:hypothetical protein